MISHKRQLFISILLVLSNISIAQKKDAVTKSIDWKEIIVIQADTSFNGFPSYLDPLGCGGGESSIYTNRNTTSIENIPKNKLRKIKKFVANNNGRIVYIDIRNLNTQWAQRGALSFVWFKCIPPGN